MITAIWPERPAREPLWERIAIRCGVAPGYCPICERTAGFEVRSENLREDVVCRSCGSFNRQRQLAVVLLALLGGEATLHRGVSRLRRPLTLWNLEAQGALHDALARRLGNGYVATEYFGPGFRSGDLKNGVLHADVQNTHFATDLLDVILSSDVLEHVPDPARAIAETHRVLRVGGWHIFTVPFYGHRFTSERRAVLDGDGTPRHLLAPQYHSDPVRPEGVLVFNVFAPQLLCELEAAGFEPRLLRVRSPTHGILGRNGLVIAARKLAAPQ
jgi:SAM-dependent methyltransferase